MAVALLSRPATAAVMASIHRARSPWLSAWRKYVFPGLTTRKQNRMFGASSRSGLIVAVSSDTVSFARPSRTSLSPRKYVRCPSASRTKYRRFQSARIELERFSRYPCARTVDPPTPPELGWRACP